MKIITGASRGIGRYLFERYIGGEDQVYGTFLHTAPPAGSCSRVDISDYYAVEDWIKSIPNLFNIELINCAAVSWSFFAHKADPIEWAELININLVGTFNVIRAVLPTMRENHYGRIVNLSSIVDRLGVPGTSAYAASKAGLSGLVRVLASENASRGITINNLNLGYFKIGMGCELPPDTEDKVRSRIPTNEFGGPETIFNAINFLIKNDYINGASLDINGGLA